MMSLNLSENSLIDVKRFVISQTRFLVSVYINRKKLRYFYLLTIMIYSETNESNDKSYQIGLSQSHTFNFVLIK